MIQEVTKKQHYVPQFLLRGFATKASKSLLQNEKKLINILKCNSSEFLFDVPIKSVLYEKFFYDKDNVIEEILRKIETPASIVISKIIDTPKLALNEEEIKTVVRFSIVQWSRTNQMREDLYKQINYLLMDIVTNFIKANFPNETEYGRFDDSKELPAALSSLNILNAVVHSPMMFDLKMHLLINTDGANNEFIISDNPLILYNTAFNESLKPNIASPFRPGAQLFLPLTEKITLCFYDGKVYKYGKSRKDRISYLASSADIEWLNKLQIRSASTFIGFSSQEMQNTILKLNRFYSNKLVTIDFFSSLHNIEIIRKLNITKEIPSFFKILKKKERKYSLKGDGIYRESNIKQPVQEIEYIQEIISSLTKKTLSQKPTT